MNQHHIGVLFFQHLFDPVQDIGGDIKEGLLVLHDGEIIIRRDAKGLQYLIQHLPMLCRNADTCLKMFRIFLERLYKRSHLYRFGTGTENEQYLFHLLYLIESIQPLRN